MSETQTIKPADLLIDEQNPRLKLPNVGQIKAQEALAAYLGKKLVVLAKDIVAHGTNPTELPIVMPHPGDATRFVVLEGNRRLVALRVLETPDAFSTAVDSAVLKQLRTLSREYQSDPVEELLCYVVENREEARHWIELRHTGENEGAGVVKWGSDEAARYSARTKPPDVQSQALDFLQHAGAIDEAARRAVPSTTLRRLLDSPVVRARLGLDLQNKQLHLVADAQRVVKALMHVVDDLTSGRVKVSHVYSKQQQERYAKDLPAAIAVPHTRKAGHGTPLSAPGSAPQTKPAAGASGSRITKKRDRLIPRDCVLGVTDQRLRDIERELRTLSLEKHTNAVSVLFRVFLELSADSYIATHALTTVTEKDSLNKKLEHVMNDLLSGSKITAHQAKPVRRAIAHDSFLAPSVLMLHQYIHNQHIFPTPTDLRANWDSLQPYVTAMWA